MLRCTSLYSLLGRSSPEAALHARGEKKIEDIREAMLSAMGPGAAIHTKLARRIRYAGDVMTLWYLRGELMGMLAGAHGEFEAHRQITRITHMFKGVMPKGLNPGASPLRRH
jgi:hypothetical protein